MADYREVNVNGDVVENPHNAFVSSSSTGVHTIKAVSSGLDGVEVVHVMGEYLSREEAQAKVDAFKKSMVTVIPDNTPTKRAELTPTEQDQYAKALDDHDRANGLGKYKANS